MLLTVVFFLALASQVHGHTYHLGDCPTVKPMEDFDIKKFLGKWYVIQKTATGSSCLINNYTEDEENPGHFKIEQISEHLLLGLTSVDHKYHYTGDLVIPNPADAADMKVRFPLKNGTNDNAKVPARSKEYGGYGSVSHPSSKSLLSGQTCWYTIPFLLTKFGQVNQSVCPTDDSTFSPLFDVAGGASYTVFMTDYNTYAGIFTCQKLAFAHRRSATIISRTKTLGKEYVDKIRGRLASFGIDPYDLSIIKQGNCTEPTEHTTSISIDEKTFTAESVADVFRKAGEKIGDGIETVADSAKKVYTKYRGDHEESKEEINVKKNFKEDAEWLP